jgi:hypothetical protein
MRTTRTRSNHDQILQMIFTSASGPALWAVVPAALPGGITILRAGSACRNIKVARNQSSINPASTSSWGQSGIFPEDCFVPRRIVLARLSSLCSEGPFSSRGVGKHNTWTGPRVQCITIAQQPPLDFAAAALGEDYHYLLPTADISTCCWVKARGRKRWVKHTSLPIMPRILQLSQSRSESALHGSGLATRQTNPS